MAAVPAPSPKPRKMIMGGGGCIGLYLGALFE